MNTSDSEALAPGVADDKTLFGEMIKMGLDLKGRGLFQRWRQIAIQDLRQRIDAGMALMDCVQDLSFALDSMVDKLHQPAMRIGDWRSMGGVENAIVPPHELIQTCEILAHMAVRWRDHTGRPTHHMIAAKKSPLFIKTVADMIGGMARRGYARDGEAIPDNLETVLDVNVWDKTIVTGFIRHSWGGIVFCRDSQSISLGPAERLQPSDSRRMIPVGVGYQNMAEPAPIQRMFQCLKMQSHIWPRINDGDMGACANDINAGPLERERPWVGCKHT